MKKSLSFTAARAAIASLGARSSRALLLLAALGILFASPVARGEAPPPSDPPAVDPKTFPLKDVPVLIENLSTKRYAFSDGAPIKGKRGAEGGWLASSGFASPKVVGADANYYNRALWTITKQP